MIVAVLLILGGLFLLLIYAVFFMKEYNEDDKYDLRNTSSKD